MPNLPNITNTIAGFNFAKIFWRKPDINQRVRGYRLSVYGNKDHPIEIPAHMTSYRINNTGSHLMYILQAYNPTGEGLAIINNITLSNSSSEYILSSFLGIPQFLLFSAFSN